MGILDGIERGLERAVNSAFAKTFRSGVQPVEISAALKRQLDIGAVIVDRDRVLTPNRFTVRVSPADLAKLRGLGDALERELRSVAAKYAKKQGYQMLGDLDVEIVADDHLSNGVLEIDPESVEGQITWAAALVVGGVQHDLVKGTNVIGRGSDVDIRLSDNGASRRHLEIDWDGETATARDLGSTNGSKVNGQRFSVATLTPDTTITVGTTSLKFVLVPKRDPLLHKRRGPDANHTMQISPEEAKNYWSSL